MTSKHLALALVAGLVFAPFAAHAATPEVRSAPQVSPAKAAIDTDGDGFVSKAEFMAMQEKRFTDMDTNKDGKISDEEHKASFEKFKAKRAEWMAKMKAENASHETPAVAEKPKS